MADFAEFVARVVVEDGDLIAGLKKDEQAFKAMAYNSVSALKRLSNAELVVVGTSEEMGAAVASAAASTAQLRTSTLDGAKALTAFSSAATVVSPFSPT